MDKRIVALGAALVLGAQPAHAQWARTHEQFYLPAEHNWVFRRNFPAADRLFNAFDYGHAILYEKLWRHPDAPASELEEKEYDFVTRRLLVSPPRLPLEEAAIEVEYVKLAPEAKQMFEWAHILHRQIYDVLGDERLSQADKDREVAAVLRYYKSRPDLAFSSLPKNMELMEGQYYSTAFRDGYPKFNGLIWGYHWLQVGLYEPLMTGRTAEERQAGVAATVARFRQMLQNAPENMPRLMPMTPAIAPAFTARYPEAAIIFDNLHGMHDVISDILASPKVPRAKKREEILRAAERYRDNTSFLMTRQEWLDMARTMGIENQGGPAVGFLPEVPRPTVARGAVMAHGGHGAHGAQPAAGQHAGHGAQPTPAQHDGHAAQAPPSALQRLHDRLMADAAIRQRIAADAALRAEMERMHAGHAMTPTQTQAVVARLLADAQVMARVHADPELHRLWSDPEVQRAVGGHGAHQH
jgi:hypothetical protein